MKHIVISIGRQFGSGGREVGKQIAEKLSIDYYDKNLLYLAAKEHGFAPEIFEHADEHASVQSGLFDWFNGYFFGSIDTQNYMSNNTLFKMQADVIRTLADTKSCVIVGRCSDYILRDNPNHISIFLHAPIDDRITRVAKRVNISREKAHELIKLSERRRADYYNYYSSKTWGMASSYDFSFNVAQLGTEKTAKLIADIANRKNNSHNF